MSAQQFSLRDLRERAERAHAWGGPGSVPATPEEVLALVEAVEASQALAGSQPADYFLKDLPLQTRLHAALARFKDYGADRDGDER